MPRMSLCANNQWLHRLAISIIVMASALAGSVYAMDMPVPVRTLTTSDGLTSDQVEALLQDSRGYLWAATRNGLVRYNGFRCVTYKSGIRSGEVLTNNDVRAIVEDGSNKIWIGTTDGITIFDMYTETFRQRRFACLRNNPVSCILPTRDRRIFIGTDRGLYEYITSGDTVRLFTREDSGNIMPQTSVKALMEDSRGNIWIGTWNEGIYRLDSSGKFHAYPRINERKSAHVIFEDSSHRIWVGTWGCGLEMLRNPYEPDKAAWVTYVNDPSDIHSLCDNIVYSIAEDPTTRTVWVGTQRGISLLNDEGNGFTTLTLPDRGSNSLREVTSIISDNTDLMWVSMLGHGAMAFSSRPALLTHDNLESVAARFGTSYIHRLMIDSSERRWLSLGSNAGLVVTDPSGRSIFADASRPYSAAAKTPFTVMSILEGKGGKVYLGTYDGGLYCVDSNFREIGHFTTENSPWLAGDRVSELFIDSRGRFWTGGVPGLTMVMPDYSYIRFDDFVDGDIMVAAIAEGNDGAIWVATSNQGMLRIEGVGNNRATYSVRRYSPNDNNNNSWGFIAVYCDDRGRIWAGSSETGLNLYDFESDVFRCVHLKWNLPGDAVASILSSKSDNLWVATNMGLVNIKTDNPDDGPVHFRVFSSSEGAQDNYFHRKAGFRDKEGKLYFGGSNGINIISDDVPLSPGSNLPVVITDIKINGVSWSDMSPDRRIPVSSASPAFTDFITLSPDNNDLMLQFGVLDYSGTPMRQKYSYCMEGYEKEWHITDDAHSFAYYGNLPSGNYTFRVRTTDDEGGWRDDYRKVTVRVEPSVWKSTWAWVLYITLTAAIVIWGLWYWQKRVKNTSEERMHKLLHAQAAELCRTKDDLDRLSQSMRKIPVAVAEEEIGEAETVGEISFADSLLAEWRKSDFSASDERFLRRAIEFIVENISDSDLSQDTFMEEMHITKSTLFRKLKALTGLSYTSFVRHIRLKAALGMLHSGDGFLISEIAYAVGFNDPKYFSLCFKKEYGILPSEYVDRFINTVQGNP